jgi:hypothetical protein
LLSWATLLLLPASGPARALKLGPIMGPAR